MRCESSLVGYWPLFSQISGLQGTNLGLVRQGYGVVWRWTLYWMSECTEQNSWGSGPNMARCGVGTISRAVTKCIEYNRETYSRQR